MAVRTIRINLEAYELLARRRRKGESFSRVIKEHFGRHRIGGDLRAALEELRLSGETLQAVDRLIRSRRRSPA